MLLGPEEAAAVLGQRADALREQLAAVDASLAGELKDLPRVAWLETEYQRTVLAAELAWVDGVVDDLRTGALTWSYDELMVMARCTCRSDPSRATRGPSEARPSTVVSRSRAARFAEVRSAHGS